MKTAPPMWLGDFVLDEYIWGDVVPEFAQELNHTAAERVSR